MFNIISGNFEISKQQIDKLKKKVSELRQNIKHTEHVLEEKVAQVEGHLGHTESLLQEMYDFPLNPAFIENKLIDLKSRSRRNNLGGDGFKERPNETWEDCENELHTLFK